MPSPSTASALPAFLCPVNSPPKRATYLRRPNRETLKSTSNDRQYTDAGSLLFPYSSHPSLHAALTQASLRLFHAAFAGWSASTGKNKGEYRLHHSCRHEGGPYRCKLFLGWHGDQYPNSGISSASVSIGHR